MLFLGVLGVVIGGRLGYCLFYKPAYYLAHPLEVFFVWQGGMSFHGGLLGRDRFADGGSRVRAASRSGR